MKKFFISYLVLCAVVTIGAVAAAGQNCPKLDVIAPSSDVEPGTPITITASVTGGDQNVTPTYNWFVSAGRITSGQGTAVIIVDTRGLDGEPLSATVEVGGYDRSCAAAWSATAFVAAKALEASKTDEFGVITREEEMARLDNFAIELQNDPTAQGYIIVYAGRKTSKAAATATAIKRIKNHLVNTRRMDESRIVFIDGGYREEPSRELFRVPAGAGPPTASPTVDPSEIKPPKPPVKKPVKKPVKRS